MSHRLKFVISVVASLAILILAGCAGASVPAPTAASASKAVPASPTGTTPAKASPAVASPAAAAPSNPNLILSTTTSTQDSGLLDVLIPTFEKQSGYKVKTIAVGTGAALQMAQNGEADVVLVHAPASELKFMNDGWGAQRKLVMHNDFVIVGPTADPAGIKGLKAPTEALAKIFNAKATFYSRGDNSGTQQMELQLWQNAGLTPKGQDWYKETGTGMGQTLQVASEKNAYTLTDRATYLAQKKNLSLDIMVEGDKSLLNIYHVITLNPQKLPKTNVAGGDAFMAFMLAPDTQKTIGEFGVAQYGQPLFFADAGKPEF